MAAQSKGQITADAALAGILVLLADQREDRVKDDKDAAKTEVLLGRVGVSAEDIAAITGKNVGAVRKALQRARAG
jgi:DNA-directed RNA polymerase specialized sigma24 family protein